MFQLSGEITVCPLGMEARKRRRGGVSDGSQRSEQEEMCTLESLSSAVFRYTTTRNCHALNNTCIGWVGYENIHPHNSILAQ